MITDNIFENSMGNSKSSYSKPDLLYFYIEKNDSQRIHSILQANPDLLNKCMTKDAQHTPLMRASFNGNLELVRLLIEMKPNVNYPNKKGETALTIAVKKNHFDVVQLLIENMADLRWTAESGLSVIEYAILPGYYQIARHIFEKLDEKAREQIRSPGNYSELAKKYAYRYVNYPIFLEAVIIGKDPAELPNYLKKEKVKFEDPVVDPNETWKAWMKRQIQFKDAPLVERSSLPENLQPQNRTLGKLHHYTNNFMSSALSQKTKLYPKENQEIHSELGELKPKMKEECDKMEVQSQF